MVMCGEKIFAKEDVTQTSAVPPRLCVYTAPACLNCEPQRISWCQDPVPHSHPSCLADVPQDPPLGVHLQGYHGEAVLPQHLYLRGVARPHALQPARAHLQRDRAVSVSCCFHWSNAKPLAESEPRLLWGCPVWSHALLLLLALSNSSECETCVVAPACSTSAWEAEAAGSELQPSQGCIVSPCHRIKFEISNLNPDMSYYSVIYSKWHLMKEFSNNLFHLCTSFPSAWLAH